MNNTSEVINVNPLLGRSKLPGETFPLCSLGLFYNDGELDESVRNGEIHVYPMSSYDEIVMRSADMVFSGKAIEDVFSRCIPQVKKPMQLLAKDVDYLLACLRVVTYGPTMDIIYEHDCENAKSHKYIVNVRELVAKATRIDPTTLETVFTTKLDNGQIVKFKPITFGNMLEMDRNLFALDEMISEEELNKQILSSLSVVIESVDEVTNKDHIYEWLNTISAGWIKQLSTVVQDMGHWGIDFQTTIECKDCHKEQEIELWTNPMSFFS